METRSKSRQAAELIAISAEALGQSLGDFNPLTCQVVFIRYLDTEGDGILGYWNPAWLPPNVCHSVRDLILTAFQTMRKQVDHPNQRAAAIVRFMVKFSQGEDHLVDPSILALPHSSRGIHILHSS